MKHVSAHAQLPLHLWIAGADHENIFDGLDVPAFRLAHPAIFADPEASVFQQAAERTCIDGECAGARVSRKHPIAAAHAHFACRDRTTTER